MKNIATISGFRGDPYNFKKAAREVAKNLESFKDPSPVPEVKYLGEWLFGTYDYKGVLVFIPTIFRDVDIKYRKKAKDGFEIFLIERFVDKLVDELLKEDIIDEAELDF